MDHNDAAGARIGDVTMRLSHKPQTMTPDGKARVIRHLKEGCACGSETATLCSRLISATPHVHLQCDGCGRSISGSMKRADHPFFQAYAEWNLDLRDESEVRMQSEWAISRAIRDEAFQAQIIHYREVFLRSAEWRELRAKVLCRSGGTCEACLSAPATEVHHDGYKEGVTPPAWLLRSVCRACHQRITDGWATP